MEEVEEEGEHRRCLDEAFRHVRCINLERRPDRWRAFASQAFVPGKVRRFDAVDGRALPAISSSGGGGGGGWEEDCHPEWDATNNARYDPYIRGPPFARTCTAGEVGCALSHVALWKELVASSSSEEPAGGGPPSSDGGGEAMLVLEDDAIFHPSFPASFAELYELLPEDWDVFYLGFYNAGPTTLVARKQVPSSGRTFSIVRPSYGFYTHAYAIRSKGATELLSRLPIRGPIDTWLADNGWFGLKVYYGMVGKSTCIVGQRRNDLKNDIAHSAHHHPRSSPSSSPPS